MDANVTTITNITTKQKSDSIIIRLARSGCRVKIACGNNGFRVVITNQSFGFRFVGSGETYQQALRMAWQGWSDLELGGKTRLETEAK
jgi:hypothetical protein